MRIIKVRAKDIYGIEGEKDYCLSDKVTALFGHNGAGKSSFIKTLNFAISGARTDSMIFAGKNSAAAMFETDNGLRVDRMVSPTGRGGYTQKCWINKQKASAEEALDQTAAGWQTKPENLKLLSSSDIGAALEKDAGKILLSYADNKLSRNDVLGMLKESGLKPAEILADDIDMLRLPTEIGWNESRDLVKNAIAKRREAKAKVQALTATQNGLIAQAGTQDPNAPTADAAKAELDNITRQEAFAQAAQKNMAEYQKQVDYRANVLNSIRACEEEIKNAGPQEDLNALKAKLKEITDSGTAAGQNKASAEGTIQSLAPLYERLGTGVCPIWNKIQCTTDMTGAKNFVKSQIDAANERAKTAQAIIDAANKSYAEINAKIQAAERVNILKERAEAMKKAIPPEPVKPAEIQVQDFSQRKVYLQAVIMADEKRMQAQAMSKDIQEAMKDVARQDFLAKAFSDEGPVVSQILSSYLAILTQAAEKAEKETGIGVVFTYNKGLDIAFRKGDTAPRPYSTLSSGEQMLAFLTVSDLLHRIASIPILLLDDLDKLDLDNLDRLLTLLDRVKDSYGNIILAGVDHGGVNEVLRKHGICNILSERSVAA